MEGTIIAVACDREHRFGKRLQPSIRLLPGLGVEGDAHAGATVQHRSRLAKTPHAPNFRQVHLVHSELFDEMAAKGFALGPGELGENVTTRGLALLDLSAGTRLRLGSTAVIEVAGLRNPCRQIDDNLGEGAMAATLERRADGSLTRKAGVMAVVLAGGEIRPGDPVQVEWVPKRYKALEPV
jgi:MOSC domain-containing protein YiiM